MTRPLRIALIQFSPLQPSSSPTASAQNLARASSFVASAAAGGATLIVFPENFLSGLLGDEKHWRLAQREHSPQAVAASSAEAPHWLETFRLLAIQHDVDIVPGTIVERAEELVEGKYVLSNVAHYVDREGRVLGRYKKRNLWWPEKDYLTQGEDDHQVFDTEWGRVGLLICWDMAWPEAFRSLLLQGVDLVICPTYWTSLDAGKEGLAHNPDSEALYLDSLIVTRAFENECCIAFVNVGGKDEEKAVEGWIGRSKVTVPFKGILGEAVGAAEQMVLVDVDLSILKDAREVYGIRRDLITKMKAAGALPEGVEP